ncbi:hypothetical protein M0Q97_11960 [Candidatus Dojkabacteria bacterium]|jgi:hypothetical protein|nr:hypothetical protein [Candidatus Dojkabacteria bacterium]
MKYIKTFENTKHEQLTSDLKAILSLINKYIELCGYNYDNYYDRGNWEMELEINSIKCTVIMSILNNKICIKVNYLKNYRKSAFDFFINYLKNTTGLKIVKTSINNWGDFYIAEDIFNVINSKKVIDDLTKNNNLSKSIKKYNL